MRHEAVIYFQNLMQFFIKKGKKPRVEKLFRVFLTDRVKEKKKEFNSKLLDLLHKCFYYAMPFVRLKTRRKRKRILYRLNFLEQPRGEKKALMSLSKKLKNQKSRTFLLNWEKELIQVASGKSDVTLKRDDLHKTALRFCPYRWKRSKRWRKKKILNKKKLKKIDFLILKWQKKRKLKKKKSLKTNVILLKRHK